MHDNAIHDTEDQELQQALLAAFGEEAIGWLHEEGQDLAEATPVAADGDLRDLLERLSQRIETTTSASALAEANSQPFQGRRRLGSTPRHVVFEVGGQRFGVPLQAVLEIDRYGHVTPLPRTPAWLRGVTNLRGQILSVTDFRSLLEMRSERPVAAERIVVIHSPQLDIRTALVVDRVLGIWQLQGNAEAVRDLREPLASFASGLATNEQGSIVLVSVDNLLACEALRSVCAS